MAAVREDLISGEESSACPSISGYTSSITHAVHDAEFEQFVIETEPRLRRALAGHMARDAVGDALAEAFAYAWEHRDRVMRMEHPAAYLFRVGQSKARTRKQGFLPWSAPEAAPDVEPGLVGALGALSPAQFQAVWLVHACGWTHMEVAEALHISASTVGSHVSRALAHLRDQLGVVVNG